MVAGHDLDLAILYETAETWSLDLTFDPRANFQKSLDPLRVSKIVAQRFGERTVLSVANPSCDERIGGPHRSETTQAMLERTHTDARDWPKRSSLEVLHQHQSELSSIVASRAADSYSWSFAKKQALLDLALDNLNELLLVFDSFTLQYDWKS